MTRNDFMKSCAGVCSCGALSTMPTAARAESADPDIGELKWKLGFVQKRFADLVQILGQTVDEASRKKVWEALGRHHGREYRGLVDKFRGDLPGFLAEIQKQWVEKVEYDAAAGTIRVVDKAANCTCPLVDRKLTPADFCNCTIGWQEEVYSAIVGKPVEVELEESILRGGSRCIFRMRITRGQA